MLDGRTIGLRGEGHLQGATGAKYSTMAHLIVREPGQIAIRVDLRHGLEVGRREPCMVLLHDARVSDRHARFVLLPGGWSVEDAGSSHAITLNGTKLTGRAPLHDGDEIGLGEATLSFVTGGEPDRIVHQRHVDVTPPAAAAGIDARLQVIYDVCRATSTMGEEAGIVDRILSTVLKLLACERALLGLRASSGGRFHGTVRLLPGGASEDVIVSHTLLDAIVSRKEGVIVQVAGIGVTAGAGALPPVTAMAVPLLRGAAIHGFLYVDDSLRAGPFEPKDLDLLVALGRLLSATVENAERFRRMAAAAEALSTCGALDDLVGDSEPMRRLKAQVQRFGSSEANVLIRGESGTGKELVACTLHAVSPRAGQALVTLNCAAIPETMVESELFGHVKGAFTGAVRDKRGKFALADGGTLFLDEIGDLGMGAQAKILRAIEEGEIQPVGSERTQRVNVRIMSATHKDLVREVEAKRFREDLYYRLNVVEIETPPLRHRGEDIERLATFLLKASGSAMGKPMAGFSSSALATIRQYAWPGNVRELRNEMERAAIHAGSPVVDIVDLSSKLQALASVRPSIPVPSATLAEQFSQLEATERRLIEQALRQAGGNLSAAARLLGISWIMMKRRAERFGVAAPAISSK